MRLEQKLTIKYESGKVLASKSLKLSWNTTEHMECNLVIEGKEVKS